MHTDEDERQCKDAAEPDIGNVLSADGSEVSANQKAGGEQQSDLEVGVAMAIVLVEGEDADRGEECAE